MTDERDTRRRQWAIVGLVVLAIVSSIAAVAAPVAAQQTATPTNTTYYDGENSTADTDDWIPGDGQADAPAMLEMIARIPGIFVGSGGLDPSGSGYEGVLLSGLIVAGAALFATVGIGIGPVAGSMLGMVLAYGLTVAGIVPMWIQPLLLFGLVGVPAAGAILRVFNR